MILILTNIRSESLRSPAGRRRVSAKLTGLVALALVVGISTVAVPRHRTADAAQLTPGIDRNNPVGFCPVNPDFINVPDNPAPRDAGSGYAAHDNQTETVIIMVTPEAQVEPVRSADMTVGMTRESDVTYMGCIPGDADDDDFEGSLNDIASTHNGEDFTVPGLFQLGLFQRQVGNGFRELALNTDAELPEDLMFHAGDDRFALAKAVNFGANHNIHTCTLNRSLNRTGA